MDKPSTSKQYNELPSTEFLSRVEKRNLAFLGLLDQKVGGESLPAAINTSAMINITHPDAKNDCPIDESPEEPFRKYFADYLAIEDAKFALTTNVTTLDALFKKFMAWSIKLNEVAEGEFRFKFVSFAVQTIERLKFLREPHSARRYRSERPSKRVQDIITDSNIFLSELTDKMHKYRDLDNDYSEELMDIASRCEHEFDEVDGMISTLEEETEETNDKTSPLLEDASHIQVLNYLATFKNQFACMNGSGIDYAINLFIGCANQVEVGIEYSAYKSQLGELRKKFLKFLNTTWEEVNLFREKSGSLCEITAGCFMVGVFERVYEFSSALNMVETKCTSANAEEAVKYVQ